MEKQDELKAFARMCVQGLSDDVELRQERETELLVHLKSAFAEERQNASDDEALKNTFKRFGDPEEISSQLIDGNAEQLSRNARIRRAAKWLLLPLLVIGVLLCIDVRGILASVTLLKSFKPSWFSAWLNNDSNGSQEGIWGDYDKINLKTRRLSADEQSLFDYYYSKCDRLEILSRLYEGHRDDAMLCAIFALELSLPEAKMREKLPEVIANGRRIDPDNSLYDYLECLMLMRESCQILSPARGISRMSNRGDIPVDDYTINDRGKLDKAIVMYRHGLSKGNLDAYSAEPWKRVQGMLKIKEDLLGGIQLLNFRGKEYVPFPSVIRSIARRVVLYCDILLKEGDKEKAVDLLATWRPLLSQYLSLDNIHLVDIFNCFRISEEFLHCAKRWYETQGEVADLEAIVDIDKKERMVMLIDNRHPFWHRSGLLASMTSPYSMESIEMAEWANERRLEAAAFDSASVSLACLCLLVAIALLGVDVFAMWIGGRRPFLFIMPQSSYNVLLIKSLLFPALLYFVLTYFIARVGGGWYVLHVISFVYLCLFWPLYYGVCCNRALKKWIHSIGAESNEGFSVSRSFNILCLFVVLLLFFGCILRPIAELRERYYARRETLVIPWEGAEIAEERVAHKLQKRLLEQMVSTKGN